MSQIIDLMCWCHKDDSYEEVLMAGLAEFDDAMEIVVINYMRTCSRQVTN